MGAGTSAIAPRVLSTFAFIDGLIRGEPEPAMEQLAAQLQKFPDCRWLPSAPGLVRRTADGMEDAELSWVRDICSLPRPLYHSAIIQAGDTIPVEAGRGCRRRCTFCALSGHWGPIYRHKPPAMLAQELFELSAMYPGSLFDLSQDPSYFSDGKRLEDFCERLLTKGIQWSCNTFIDQLSAAHLELMAAAGCRGILFGVESGCDDIQKRIGKNIDLRLIEPTLKAARDRGIATRASFIIGHPHESIEALEQTVKIILKTREVGAADTSIEILRAYPGTELYQTHVEHLLLEPLLSAAGIDDRAAQVMMAQYPWLLTDAYRLAGPIDNKKLLALWITLMVFPEVVQILYQKGLNVYRFIQSLELNRVQIF
jgi:radical SAM superfamily enzyme YgiQ (UPF0313 family)